LTTASLPITIMKLLSFTFGSGVGSTPNRIRL
jgi:hypothetical protein